MKKFISLAMAFMLALSLVACSGNSNAPSGNGPPINSTLPSSSPEATNLTTTELFQPSTPDDTQSLSDTDVLEWVKLAEMEGFPGLVFSDSLEQVFENMIRIIQEENESYSATWEAGWSYGWASGLEITTPVLGADERPVSIVIQISLLENGESELNMIFLNFIFDTANCILIPVSGEMYEDMNMDTNDAYISIWDADETKEFIADLFIELAAEEDTEKSVKEVEMMATGVDKDASLLSSNGVFIRDIQFFPDRNIVKLELENTTTAAKKGYIEISCLDEYGLQLKKITVSFTIPALQTVSFQNDATRDSNSTPEGTVLVKAIRILVVDN